MDEKNPQAEKRIKKRDQKALTSREIFDQIVLLQKQMTENNSAALYRMTEAVSDIMANDLGEFNSEKKESIEEICNVFATREATLNEMLLFYQKAYADAVKREAMTENAK